MEQHGTTRKNMENKSMFPLDVTLNHSSERWYKLYRSWGKGPDKGQNEMK